MTIPVSGNYADRSVAPARWIFWGLARVHDGLLRMVGYSHIVASEIMTKALVCAQPQQDLQELDRLLIERHISGVPVVADGRLVGVISRSDIARVQVLMESLDGMISDQQRWDDTQADGFQHAEHSESQAFRQMTSRLLVKDAMRDQVTTCPMTMPVREVADLMVRRHIHRVIVVDGERPVGIISSLDICRLVAETSAARR